MIQLIKKVNAEGFLLLNVEVEAADYNSKTERTRQLMLVVDMGVPSIDQTSADFVMPSWAQDFKDTLNELKLDRSLVKLQNVTLAKDDPLLKSWHEEELQSGIPSCLAFVTHTLIRSMAAVINVIG